MFAGYILGVLCMAGGAIGLIAAVSDHDASTTQLLGALAGIAVGWLLIAVSFCAFRLREIAQALITSKGDVSSDAVEKRVKEQLADQAARITSNQ